ncbi:HigA family addiction module antitoxin [Alkalilimnicola sp. S0819]|uniref:HigA family addiction module antitoxin n=1 Tax=Alkalilimnicola sp. S0819 TaxID=2613922 RepID=UPI001D00F11C|nr:HigA family addiction module antitoxin [Alkalilimnicola sp. S0819]
MTSPGAALLAPIHPGEILREEYMLPLGLSANALARALQVPPNRISTIVNEQRAISADTALRLACYFGGEAETWLNLQKDYELRLARQQSLERIRNEVAPRSRQGAPL